MTCRFHKLLRETQVPILFERGIHARSRLKHLGGEIALNQSISLAVWFYKVARTVRNDVKKSLGTI